MLFGLARGFGGLLNVVDCRSEAEAEDSESGKGLEAVLGFSSTSAGGLCPVVGLESRFSEGG